MPIKFNCPKCGQKGSAPDNAAGVRGKCPKCGAVVVVPRTSAAAPAPTIGWGENPPLERPPSRKKDVREEEPEEVDPVDDEELNPRTTNTEAPSQFKPTCSVCGQEALPGELTCFSCSAVEEVYPADKPEHVAPSAGPKTVPQGGALDILSSGVRMVGCLLALVSAAVVVFTCKVLTIFGATFFVWEPVWIIGGAIGIAIGLAFVSVKARA